MDELTSITAMRAWARDAARRRVAFVPTMGALHEGHLHLVDRARQLGDLVVASIFVNPLQFGPGEDLTRYPRDLPRDRALAQGRGVDALFVPDAGEMYPEPLEVRVTAGKAAELFEGAARPGHFTGMLTVVAKLFAIVQPRIAVFGRKDFQQAALVQRLVADLNLPVTVDVAPTVRARDGLALSSRNIYLSPAERTQARSLSAALRAVEAVWRRGETDAATLQQHGLAVMRDAGLTAEYFAFVDVEMRPQSRVGDRTAAIVAARVGATRLIDNVVLGDGVAADPVEA